MKDWHGIDCLYSDMEATVKYSRFFFSLPALNSVTAQQQDENKRRRTGRNIRPTEL